MARKRSKIPRSAEPAASSKRPPTTGAVQEFPDDSVRWYREAIESIVVAVILAFLFRSFEAEAFVIPTGSMAPTLQGRHKDVSCPECGHQYRVGASLDAENPPPRGRGKVVSTVCPICNYQYQLDEYDAYGYRPNDQASFTGDRILVNKFAYEWSDPEPWDVVVFKYPGNAKQNYIKRCVAVPGDQIAIQYGDIFRGKPGSELPISRKPIRKIPHLLQLVHDTTYPAPVLVQADWPNCWRSPNEAPSAWSSAGTDFMLKQTAEESWLRYFHIRADFDAWESIGHEMEPAPPRPSLISDFYAYNGAIHETEDWRPNGMHWVGDLGLEAVIQVQSSSGELFLDLVEGCESSAANPKARHFRCTIDIATGTATLTMPEGESFADASGPTGNSQVTAQTKVNGPGKYRLLFANVDDQLLLWVNGWQCKFSDVTTFNSPVPLRPSWSSQDQGDLAPLGIGGKDIQLAVKRLRVLRDTYYSAVGYSDYKCPTLSTSAALTGTPYELKSNAPDHELFQSPDRWDNAYQFRAYPRFERTLAKFPDNPAKDQFFMLGDNSPQSKDSRLWPTFPDDEFYVERELLIGKAVVIYWPHPWGLKIPGTNQALWVIPNFWRIGRIR